MVVGVIGGEIGEAVMTQFGKAFGHKVFGKTIPKEVTPLFAKGIGGISEKDAGIFSRAIDFDPEVREPLDGLFRQAADGNDDAYMLMDQMARGFEAEDAALKARMNAQTRLGAQKKIYADAQKERKDWNIKSDEIDQAATLTGDPGRRVKADVQTQFTGPKEHTSGSRYSRQGKMITNRHHAIGLDDANKVVTQHQSYQGVTPDSKSPIIEAREKVLGIKSGNFEQNMVDILDRITGDSRKVRKDQIGEMTGGTLHPTTINDALGGSKYNPRDITDSELDQFELMRQRGAVKTFDEFLEKVKPDKGTKFTEGQFPDIRVYAPGAKAKDAPLETIKIKTNADHANRFNLIFDVLKKNGIDTTAAQKNFSLKKLRIDPNLDIYGVDHPLVHRLINTLKDKPGTALNKIQELGPDGIFNLSLDEAIRLDIQSIREMETVLANVLQYRYGQIEQLFSELYPNGYKGLGETFDELGAPAKQQFVKEHTAQIAVRGNIEKQMTLKKSLKPIKNWNNHIADTFGWSPQSLWTSIEELEEIAKELSEKVPTTMPLPGVE